MPTGTVTLHRILKAPPERVFRAFTSTDALAKWNAPHGFTATVHAFDARPGGTFRISFTNFTTGQSHQFGGAFEEFVPSERLVTTDRFDDPTFPGTLTTTVTLRAVPAGTELSIVQEGLPEVIPIDGCQLGWQESLTLLALLVETEVRE